MLLCSCPELIRIVSANRAINTKHTIPNLNRSNSTNEHKNQKKILANLKFLHYKFRNNDFNSIDTIYI